MLNNSPSLIGEFPQQRQTLAEESALVRKIKAGNQDAVAKLVMANMREALLRTYNAMPEPKWVVALGDCAANCGVFAGSPAVVGPLADILPVDLHVSGCPPAPIEIVKGLLALIEARAPAP